MQREARRVSASNASSKRKLKENVSSEMNGVDNPLMAIWKIFLLDCCILSTDWERDRQLTEEKELLGTHQQN